jgi:small-conductance mechanosensitive channel
LGSYVIFIITFLVALNSIGLDLSSFAMIAGALSVGIGFGLQNVVSNFISGIILMFEKSIRVGDIVEIDQTLKGTISKIDMRSTIVNTFDNIDVIIPNSSFIANNVINYTYGDRTRRLHIPFGVAYGTPVDKVKEVVLEALEKSDLAFIRTKEDKRPEVWMSSMNASSVDYELLVWVNAATDKTEQSSRMKDFLELIYTTFYERGIEIPFPQLDVHFKKDQTE